MASARWSRSSSSAHAAYAARSPAESDSPARRAPASAGADSSGATSDGASTRARRSGGCAPRRGHGHEHRTGRQRLELRQAVVLEARRVDVEAGAGHGAEQPASARAASAPTHSTPAGSATPQRSSHARPFGASTPPITSRPGAPIAPQAAHSTVRARACAHSRRRRPRRCRARPARSMRSTGTATGTTRARPVSPSAAAASALHGNREWRRAHGGALGHALPGAREAGPVDRRGRVEADGVGDARALQEARRDGGDDNRAGPPEVCPALRRAARASTRSVTAGWRRRRPARPTATRTTRQVRPSSPSVVANASSARRSPGRRAEREQRDVDGHRSRPRRTATVRTSSRRTYGRPSRKARPSAIASSRG